jgi:hypothetical protein
MDQDYCDWCYGPLTQSARRDSIALGLIDEFSWCCEPCIGRHAYQATTRRLGRAAG